MDTGSKIQVVSKIDELESRLAEAEQLIEAIKAGEVDAFAIRHNEQAKVYTLESGDYAYRILIEKFREGALNMSEDGLIVYSNTYFHELLGLPYEKVVSSFIHDFIHPDSKEVFKALFAKALGGQSKGEINLMSHEDEIPVYVSLTSLYPHLPTVGMIVTDLSVQKKYEKESAEKNHFIETLLDSSPDIIIVLDHAMKVISANKKALSHFLHHDPGSIKGKHFPSLIKQQRKEMESIIREAIQGKEIHKQETHFFGEETFYDLDLIPLKNGENYHALMLTFRDVTDHVNAKQNIIQANQELQERTLFIETIIEASNELIAVYDKDLTLLTINKATEAFTGRPREQMVGKKLSEFYPESKGSKAESDLKRALKGEFIQNKPFKSELTGKDIQNYITPLYNSMGKVYAALAIGRDVTEILQSEQELRRSQEHFSTLFRVSPVAKTITYVSDGTVIDVNPAWERMFGIRREDVVGKKSTELGLTTMESRVAAAKFAESREEKVDGREMSFNLPDGRDLHTYVSLVTLELDGQKCFLIAYFDITQRKIDEEKIEEGLRQLEEKNNELEKMNAELSSFSYIASHDLQEPLRKIQTFCNLIIDKEGAQLSDFVKGYFERILVSASRMQTLIAALLEYSRTNTTDLVYEKVKLNTVVEEVRTNFNELIREQRVTLTVGKLPSVKAVPIQMLQLFSNLILNSIKYRKPDVDPVIHISSVKVPLQEMRYKKASAATYWKITLKDNGIGFEPGQEENIFGLFKRLHLQTEYEGTGIGLAICKKIVENHKGFIKATGNPGEGAVFDIYLPAGS